MHDSITGTKLRGYAIRELIGEGSFGAVYKAHQEVIEREVAIKVIYPALANYPEFIRRFDAEARLIAGLEHPQIVPIYDYWRDPTGAYLVMRWIRGGNLRGWLEAQLAKSDSLPEAETIVHIIGQVASAVGLAHRYGVIHRDIKPENILIDEHQNTYLTDFGIARLFGSTADDNLPIVGSPAYAAPEQLREAQLLPQSDQYSLAIITFEMLTGQHPFSDLFTGSYDDLVSKIGRPLPTLRTLRPDLPSQLDEVLQRGAAPDAKSRFADMHAFALGLREALEFRAQQKAETLYFQGQKLERTPNGTLRGPDGQPVVDAFLPPVADYEVAPNPYRGLQAFDETDSQRFFGRERLTEHLLTRLAEKGEFSRFLAVVGPSGSGKSSLVKAAVVPALRAGRIPGSDQWFILHMTPATNARLELRNALLSIATNTDDSLHMMQGQAKDSLHKTMAALLPTDKSEVLLVIDQFEELFTIQTHERDVEHILDNLYYALVHPNSRFRLLITMRADFYDRPLMYENFSMLLQSRTEIAVPMRAEELERAIVEPARAVGVAYEPAVVAEIIAEMSGQLGALPLLQFGLTELYNQRDQERNLITLEGYQKLGGILGALAQQAESTYIALDAQQQALARQIFLRLVTLGEGSEDTRRRVALEEILHLGPQPQIIRAVIDRFGNARLLTFDRDPTTRHPTVEVAHEAILREWTRLRAWLDESRNDVRQQRILANLADEWREAGQDASYLLTGARLQQFESWLVESRITLTTDEQAYMDVSLQAREQYQTRLAEQQAQREALEQRARGRLRLLVIFSLLAAAGAFALSLLAFSESENARLAQDEAVSAQATSDANAQRSQSAALVANAQAALSNGDPELALALAIEATRFDHPSPSASGFLVERALAPGTRFLLQGHQEAIRDVITGHAGDTLITSATDGTIVIWDAHTGEAIHILEAHTDAIHAIALSPDGTTLLSTSFDGTAILWRMAAGERFHTFEPDDGPLSAAAFSPDGAQIALASENGTIHLWSMETYERLAVLSAHTESIQDVNFDPTGAYLVAGDEADRVIIWDLETNEPRHVLEEHAGDIRFTAFSPDGARIVSGSDDGFAIIWDVESGEVETVLRGHTRIVHDGAFSPDGRTIMTASSDGTLIEWDVSSGSVLRRFSASSAIPLAVAFGPDGASMLVGYADATARLWGLSSPTETWRYAAGDFGLVTMAYDSARNFLITSPTARDIVDLSLRPVKLVELDAETGELLAEIPVSDLDLIAGIAYHRASDTLATALFSGQVIVWDATTWEERYILTDGITLPTRVRISPQGDIGVVGTFTGDLLMWNMEDQQIVQTFDNHTDSVLAVAFTADGQLMASGGRDDRVILWDVNTGDPLIEYETANSDVFSLTFDNDGGRLFATFSNRVVVWDTQTGDQLQIFEGHTATVTAVALSPDERLVISGGDDRQLIVWDALTGERLYTLTGHTAAITDVVFADDASAFYSTSFDGSLRRWELPTTNFAEDILSWIDEARYVATLTCEQIVQYRIDTDCLGGA
ncbi:MAG: protein kinase domain-containing protein [Anaerolineales bacterium]